MIKIRQCCKHVDLAMVYGHATEPGLSKAKLLIDDTKWVLNFGHDVGLSGFHQILQPALLGVG